MKRKIITVITGMLMMLGLFGAPAMASTHTTNKPHVVTIHGIKMEGPFHISANVVKRDHLAATSGYRILNGTSGIGSCLDAASQNYDNNGDSIQIYTCNSNPEQLYNLEEGFEPNSILIQNVDGKCIDAASGSWPSDGEAIQLYTCETNQNEQNWQEVGYGTNVSGLFSYGSAINNHPNGFCIDANSNDWPDNNDDVQLWGCGGTPEQNWYTNAPLPVT